MDMEEDRACVGGGGNTLAVSSAKYCEDENTDPLS